MGFGPAQGVAQVSDVGSINLSAGTTSSQASAFTFSNSNRVSFGLNGATLTAQHALNFSAGTTSNNISDGLTFSNSNGVSFGLNGSTITGSVATSLTNFNISAGTTSNNLSAVTFSNSNGVSFGLNGSTVTGSVATSLTNINFSAGTTSNNLSAITFSNSNGVSFGLNGSTVTGSVATSLTNVNLSAGTTSNNLSAFVFSNSNNVSFGLNGSTVTGTVTVATSLTNVNLSAGTTSNNLSAFVFSNSNNVSFGLNGSTVTGTVTVATSLTNVNLSAGTTSNNLSAFVFSNSNGVTFGLNGSTVTASVNNNFYISSFINPPNGLVASTVLTFNAASVSHAAAVLIPNALSASFIRLPALMTTNSTTYGTTGASLSASVELYSTWNAVFYSLGTGGSSKSLQSVASGSVGATLRNSISVAANGTQYSITQAYTYPLEGGTTSTSSGYSISDTNYSWVTTNWQSLFTTNRFIDINFASSLSAGPYWLVMGYSSSSATNSTGISLASNCAVSYSNHYGNSQANLTFAPFGATNSTSGGLMGAGSFSTAGGGTTNSIPISAISSIANNAELVFQMLRSA